MNIDELAAVVDLETDIAARHIAPFRFTVEEMEWQPLEVPAEQSVTLDADDDQFRHLFRRLRPENIGDVREWVGIPQRVYSQREVPEIGVVPSIRLSPTLTSRIAAEDLNSISPTARLEDLELPQKAMLIGAARNLVFGKVRRANLGTPLYRAAEVLVLQRLFPIFFATYILVGPGATLKIAPSVASLVAYRIRIWQGGRIVTPRHSYVSFHCYSVEGGIV